jgi:hypothetical protein
MNDKTQELPNNSRTLWVTSRSTHTLIVFTSENDIDLHPLVAAQAAQKIRDKVGDKVTVEVFNPWVDNKKEAMQIFERMKTARLVNIRFLDETIAWLEAGEPPVD